MTKFHIRDKLGYQWTYNPKQKRFYLDEAEDYKLNGYYTRYIADLKKYVGLSGSFTVAEFYKKQVNKFISEVEEWLAKTSKR